MTVDRLERGSLLVRSILAATTDSSELAEDGNALLAEIFDGFPVIELVPMLRSLSELHVRTAIFVLSESGPLAGPVVRELVECLGHESATVRCGAIDALLSAGPPAGAEVFVLEHVSQHISDGDRRVRGWVLRFLCRLRPDRLSDAARELEVSGARWADFISAIVDQPTGSRERLIERANDEALEVRLFAAAAAVVVADVDSASLEALTSSDEDEIRDFARYATEFIVPSRRRW